MEEEKTKRFTEGDIDRLITMIKDYERWSADGEKTEEEKLEAMVEERLRKKRIQSLKMLENIIWTFGLVIISLFAGFAVIEGYVGFIVFSIVITAYGIVGPMMIDKTSGFLIDD